MLRALPGTPAALGLAHVRDVRVSGSTVMLTVLASAACTFADSASATAAPAATALRAAAPDENHDDNDAPGSARRRATDELSAADTSSSPLLMLTRAPSRDDFNCDAGALDGVGHFDARRRGGAANLATMETEVDVIARDVSSGRLDRFSRVCRSGRRKNDVVATIGRRW